MLNRASRADPEYTGRGYTRGTGRTEG